MHKPWWWSMDKNQLQALSDLQDLIIDNLEFTSKHLMLMDDIMELFHNCTKRR